MKPAALLLLFLTVSATAVCAREDFMAFEARTFTQADAERLADAEFRARYGECGGVIFKERRFEAWVFATRVGYAGMPADDIVVFSTTPSSVPAIVATARWRTTPGQLTRLLPTAGLPNAGQLFLSDTSEHGLRRSYSLPVPR